MDIDSFKRDLAARGYPEVLERQWGPGQFIDTHTHDFAVRALVLEGDVVLGCEGTTRRYGPGDIFMLDAKVPHTEQYGAEGAKYLVGRRYPAS